jgi:hypothetical protein
VLAEEGHSRYTRGMARGWESKSVAEQQAEAASPDHAFPNHNQFPLSPDQVAKHQRSKGLQLSRQSVLHRLQAAGHPRHRKMLEDALADLEATLAEMG